MNITLTKLGRLLVLALPLALLLLGGSVAAQDIATGEGETVFQTQCAACHQATGAGIPAAFPPLAGHVYELVGAEGGRSYPILVTLYGLVGPIMVHGVAFNGLMPPVAHLSDEQIADVLNYIMVAWDDIEELEAEFEPYTPEEVAEQRGLDLDAPAVHAIRATLDLE